MSREMRENNDSSEERSSQRGQGALSTGTDVNKLTTSKDINILFSIYTEIVHKLLGVAYTELISQQV